MSALTTSRIDKSNDAQISDIKSRILETHSSTVAAGERGALGGLEFDGP